MNCIINFANILYVKEVTVVKPALFCKLENTDGFFSVLKYKTQ